LDSAAHARPTSTDPPDEVGARPPGSAAHIAALSAAARSPLQLRLPNSRSCMDCRVNRSPASCCSIAVIPMRVRGSRSVPMSPMILG
jgi:hypothetical protein